MVDFGAPPAREVRARPYVYQQAVLSSTIPIHASISVETTHTRLPQATQANPPQTAQPTGPSETPQVPRLPNTSALSFMRNLVRPASQQAPPPSAAAAAPSANPAGANQPTPSWRAVGSQNAQGAPRQPTVHVLHPGGGPHPFGRLPIGMTSQGGWTPVTLAGPMPPMVYMEVRSNNQPEDLPPAGQSPTALGEFDDFLPCHSRHLARATRSDASRPRPTVVPAAAAAFTSAAPTANPV